MCFSAPASFVSGGLVSAVGVATLYETRHPRQILFASLPLLFGLHQLEERFAWLALDGEIPPTAGTVAYVIATCFPRFFSGYRWIVLFGVLNLLALAITAMIKQLAFTSVWCAFAAVASMFIFWHFHNVMRHEDYSSSSSVSAVGC